jgi:hypothetical protein
MFVDEKKLREYITEVYSEVCNNEQAPTNLQLERVAELRRQVDDAAARSQALEKEFGDRIRAGLARQVKKG